MEMVLIEDVRIKEKPNADNLNVSLLLYLDP